jgi:hypothetical protein
MTEYQKSLFYALATHMGEIPHSEIRTFILTNDYKNMEYYTQVMDSRNMFNAGIEYAEKLAKETQNA